MTSCCSVRVRWSFRCDRLVWICSAIFPIVFSMTFVVGCAVRLGLWGCQRTAFVVCSVVFFFIWCVVCRASQPSTYFRCANGAPIRVPHGATECEGEVLILCTAQEMTVSDTVCCPNVLFRSICHRLTPRVQTGESTQRGPLEFGFSYDCVRDCPCVV